MSIINVSNSIFMLQILQCRLLDVRPVLKLDLCDKEQPTIKLQIRFLSQTSIPYLIRHASVILIVGLTCKDLDANKRTLLEEK